MLEFRLALRLLRKQPVVTLTTLFALTIGIGMATTGFTLLDSVLYSRLPYPNGDRFVLFNAYTEPQAQRRAIEAERFRFFADHASSFEHLGAFQSTFVNLVLPSGEVVPVNGTTLTPGSIDVFPYTPVLGRTLRAEDGRPGSAPAALIRESLWRRHFSSDPGVIGTMTTMSGVRRTIVGVMPDAFKFPNSGEVWLPMDTSAPGTMGSSRTFGVLKNDREPAAADAEIAALSAQMQAADPGAPRLRVVVVRFTEALSQGIELLGVVLVSGLLFVLIVIAANIANLVLARTVARSRELAVRTALGATRHRLIGQVFTEVLIVGAIAAIVGLTASQATLAWLRGTMTDMPFWVDFTASPRTMLFAVAATVLTALVGGVAPAFRATRSNTSDVLAASGRGTSVGLGKIGGLMVAAQVALSIALLNGSLLMARGVAGYLHPTLHVPAHEVLTARVVAGKAANADVVSAVAAIPTVTAAGIASSLPGESPAARMTTIEPLPGGSESVPRSAPVVEAGPGFFDTFGAQAQAGRLFDPGDFAERATPVAIVNQPFVDKVFGGVNPVGRRLRMLQEEPDAQPEPWREIVGVVPDLGLSAGDATMAAGLYLPMRRAEYFNLALRTTGDARRLDGPLRKALNNLDPSIQVREIRPLEDVGYEDRAAFAVIGAALAALGGMALLLSVVGTYAILSLSVTRRTREIGIRAALGATHRQVLQSIMGRTLLPPALGAAAGIALGQALVSARGIFAWRLPDGSGPWGLPVLGLIMIAAAVLSSWVPARRALAVSPADALRAE
jgi:putative ABC transport system permease protein